MTAEPPRLADLIARRFGLAGGPDLGAQEAAGDSTLVRALLTRTSIRAFGPEPIPEAVMTALLAAAFSAPSKSDLQQASVVRLTDPAQRRAVAGLMAQAPWVAEAPELLVFLADGRRFPRVAERAGRPFANDHLDAFFNATVDAAIVLTACLLAAESLGLGGCPLSEIRDRAEALAEILELPARVVPVAGLALGRPAEQPRLKTRLPLDLTVHRDRYDDGGLAEAVERYDEVTAVETPAARQRAVARFGVAARYGWSEDRTRQYATPARADFGRFVRSRGFNLD